MNWCWKVCRQTRERLCLLASDALPEDQRAETTAHLATCLRCQNYLAGIQQVVKQLNNFHDKLPAIEVSKDARLRWAEAVRRAGIEPSTAAKESGGWWHDLFWSARYAWAGMAALWLMMWIVDWENSPVKTSRSSASVPSMIEAMHEEQRLLAELLPVIESQPAEPPRQSSPPRSERKTKWASC